jgi:hypothetical protein
MNIIRKVLIEGWFVIEGGHVGQQIYKLTIGLVLLPRIHYVINWCPGELSQE